MTLLGSTIAKLLILQAQSVKWFEMCPLFCVFVVCPHISHVCVCYSHMFRLNVHLKLCFVLAFKVKLQSILFPYVFSHLLYPWQSFLSPMCSFLMWRLWPSLLSFLYWQMWHLNETPWCRVAGVGWLSGTAAESLRAFGERVFANFRNKNVLFYNCGKTGHLWLPKDLHTHRHVPSNALFDV